MRGNIHLSTKDTVEECDALLVIAILDALFDHVACKLVSGKVLDITQHKIDDALAVGCLAMFNDMLSYVVSKLVLDQICREFGEICKDKLLDSRISLLEETLDDSAAICVCGVVNDVVGQGEVDEASVFAWHYLNDFLNHVVALFINHEIDDIA